MNSPHYVVVTGGVISGNGKGITSASIGACMKARGLSVNVQKFDMYLNVDAGTLKPGKHGEVFVTKDGAETDLDLGHYERFLGQELTQSSSVMQGRILKEIIDKERSGGFNGDDVQVIPHVTGAIMDKMVAAAKGKDVHIIELGGTIGDYEGLAFAEAARQLSHRVGRKNVTYVHVVYLPYLEVSGEIKTKPAQNSARDLRSIGIMPDILVARCEHDPGKVRWKLSIFTDVPEKSIAVLQNAKTVYEVPLTLEKQGIAGQIAQRIGSESVPDMSMWKTTSRAAVKQYSKTIKVALVAKYLDNLDTYMSVVEALKAAAWQAKVNLDMDWIDAEALEPLTKREVSLKLMPYHGIVLPGGFGERGVEGMIKAADYTLRSYTPYLGICLGLQVAAIAGVRSTGLAKANSTEVDPTTPDPVICTIDGQEGKQLTGGTMRLGNYDCDIKKDTLAYSLYGTSKIVERHRHRYELNPAYTDHLTKAGLIISGTCPANGLAEILEAPKHPFYIAGQFHPEFLSRPHKSRPLFVGFVRACKKVSNAR